MSLSGQECTGYGWGVLEGTLCVTVCVCMFVKGQTQRPPSAAAVLDQSECCLAALS